MNVVKSYLVRNSSITSFNMELQHIIDLFKSEGLKVEFSDKVTLVNSNSQTVYSGEVYSQVLVIGYKDDFNKDIE